MIRNLKVLGLALVAVFAMGAVAASAASAANQGKLTSDGPVTLTVTETGAKGSDSNSLHAFGSKVECFGSTYAGHKVGGTSFLASGETTATLTPTYNQKECRSFTGATEREATVETNGCDFVFHIGETTGGVEGTYGVTADVVCPVGNKIHVGVWELGAKHETSNRLCTVEVGAQTGLAGAHVTNTPASDDFDVTGTFTNIAATEHGLCVLTGGALLLFASPRAGAAP